MDIQVTNRQKDFKIDKRFVKALVRTVLKYMKAAPDEVAIYFVTEKEISFLHNQFFQDPTPTDCISFPIDQSHLGEVFVCPAVAIAYAKEKNLNVQKEVALYIIHGLLHLLGYDDLDPKARRIMRKKEKSCMDLVWSTFC